MSDPYVDYADHVVTLLTDEIVRLRAHIATLHRLNGWSKQKGWWCSCGEVFGRFDDPNRPPWGADGRADAELLHADHVGFILTGDRDDDD